MRNVSRRRALSEVEQINSKIRELPKNLTLTIRQREGYKSHATIYVD